MNELEAINRRLAEIGDEKRQLLQRKQQLQQSSTKPRVVPRFSTDQKVAMFQRLFKGRTDVFATRWQNAKGRNGYSVACHNEWVAGKCNKPRIKCQECSHRAYQSLDTQAIHEHLSGQHIVGLYPLLPNDACHLLAVDFDKTGWQEAVKALSQACDEFKVPHAIEISRSGNGAHLWIFFDSPVPARDARRFGFALLDKAMEIQPNISFESYDRLFPNQDTLPEGGFGNLIALPLQYQARKQGGFSQFVDAALKPYPDQWEFLSGIQKISAKQLMEILSQLNPIKPEHMVLEDQPPWEQTAPIKSTPITDCPEQVTLILANHIYLLIESLPALLIARLKRLASFSNPVFFKTQALRFSTNGIPRFISCARIEQGYLSLPRGCFDEVVQLLEEQGIKIVLDDKRCAGQVLESLVFAGELRKPQKKAVAAMTSHDTGILHAPTAFGKTVTAIGLISQRAINTLILTHSKQLLEQWKERIETFTTGVKVGVMGGGRKKPSGQIDVATYQSLINRKENTVSELTRQYGQVIIDECHHISAPQFERVLNEVNAKYVIGLTATPHRQDGHQKIMFMLAGPVRHKVKTEPGKDFEQTVVVTQRHDAPPQDLASLDSRPHIAAVYRWLAENSDRNEAIVRDVAGCISTGRQPLVLTERRGHAEVLAEQLVEKGLSVVTLKGGMGAKESRSVEQKLATAQVVVATGKYVGEGFDLPRLDTLFLALPIAWKGLLAQYAGRIHRQANNKKQVTVYDFMSIMACQCCNACSGSVRRVIRLWVTRLSKPGSYYRGSLHSVMFEAVAKSKF